MPFDSAPITSPIIDALCKSKAYLVAHGWCRWTMGEDNGPVCVIGAAWYGAGPGHNGALVFLAKAAGTYLLGRWNDSPERTYADVLGLYDRAIELAIEEASIEFLPRSIPE